MIEIKTVLYVIGALAGIVGAIVSFFVMQAKQNMKIEQLEEKVKELKEELASEIAELKRKQSKNSEYQIETEKSIEVITTKLDHILQAIAELKAERGK